MKKESIIERENEFIADFEELGDWMLQYEYLLYFMDDVNDIPEQERTDDLKVKGCVSNAWLRISHDPFKIELTSDALIIKGTLGCITTLIGDASPAEIAAWRPRFIEDTALKKQLGVDRQKGIASILAKIREASID